ncbi:MAG: SGNH/GDSL hydrolase family protein [Lentisphaeria bacterium]
MVKQLLFSSLVLSLAAHAGEVSRLPYEVNQLLVVGDSISRHGPAEYLGWQGDWGMAATCAANDFAHRLQARLAAGQGKPVALRVEAVGGGTVAGKLAAAKELAALRADLMVIQLGENDREPEDLFRNHYAALVALLRGANPGAHLVCTGVWSPPDGRSARNDTIRAVCRQYGLPFADITAVCADPRNYGGVSGRWSHPGVCWHPGDGGMAGYAEAIFNALQAGVQAVPADAGSDAGPVASAVFREDFAAPASAGLFAPAGVAVREPAETGFCLRVTAVNGGTVVRRALPVAALKGRHVLLTARVKVQAGAAGNGVVVRLELLNAEGIREQLPAAAFRGESGWTEIRLPAAIPGNTVQADLVLGLDAAPGTAWFSDLRLEPAP